MDIKENLGRAAADIVENGMVVGLGTGTTASYFVKSLARRCQEGLDIIAVTTSKQTESLASELGIPVRSIDDVDHIDLTVDGADEVDRMKRMIKGGGGALLREKIVATTSDRVVIIVDEGKCVGKLGAFGLPVEIVPFGYRHTIAALNALGYEAHMRTSDGAPFVSDGGNFIVDIQFGEGIENPEEKGRVIGDIVGVVETGFFFDIADTILVGYADGHIETY